MTKHLLDVANACCKETCTTSSFIQYLEMRWDFSKIQYNSDVISLLFSYYGTPELAPYYAWIVGLRNCTCLAPIKFT